MMPHSRIWEAYQSQKSVSTDTRKIKPGDIYFALKGENFDGNQFAAAALASGAAYAVVDDADIADAEDKRYILVPDTLKALQWLGHERRMTFNIPFIGITGSNGKTTTKELLHAVLAAEKRAYATTGNLNNHIGVPLTLLAMPVDTEIAVIEMGANKPKDIEELVNIAEPQYGIITIIGHAHLEGMGGLDGVQKTKGEMFAFLKNHNGFAFVNEADPRVRAEAMGLERTVGYAGEHSPFRIVEAIEDATGQSIRIMAEGEELTIRIQMPGFHNALNALLAFTVGRHFGISESGILAALANYVPKMNRSQLVEANGRKILLDAYNANPSSMEATIRSIAQQGHQKVALLLGDMFELGTASHAMHADLWKYALETLPEALVIGIGQRMLDSKPSDMPNAVAFQSIEAAQAELLNLIEAREYLLIKGSRGMALERLLPILGIPKQ